MKTLDMSENHFTGPEIGNFQHLEILQLVSNQFEGNIPPRSVHEFHLA